MPDETKVAFPYFKNPRYSQKVLGKPYNMSVTLIDYKAQFLIFTDGANISLCPKNKTTPKGDRFFNLNKKVAYKFLDDHIIHLLIYFMQSLFLFLDLLIYSKKSILIFG